MSIYTRGTGLTAPVKDVLVECARCCGSGYVYPGTCYRCGGPGLDPTRRGYRFPDTWSDDQIERWENARQERAIKARERAAQRRLAKWEAQWAANVERFPVLVQAENFRHGFVEDIVEKGHRYDLTERQADAVARILTAEAERQAAIEQRAAESTSEFLGAVDEKVTVTGEVKVRRSIESRYGTSLLVVLADDYGNEVKFFSTAQAVWNLELGDRVTITATVKGHEEYGGVKQTLVKRPRVDGVLSSVG